ncbi:MAG: ABC transporter substrate-binding protein [bacterium]
MREPFRGLLYVPFYLTEALGAFEDEGLSVHLETATSPAESVQSLLEGKVDVCWGGPMRVLHHFDRDPECPLLLFAEAVTRDPFFLIGKTSNPGFRLSDLTGARLATVSEVPTPWLCLQEDLRRAGIDPDTLAREANRTMAENAAALRAGEVDVIQVFEPFAQILTAEGVGHIWRAAAERGVTAYTSFIATRQTLKEREDDLLRMTRALFRAERWLRGAGPEQVGDAVSDYFPELEREVLNGAIGRYQALRVWGEDPVLHQEGFDRLKAALLSGGWITRDTPYSRCVEPRLAERVVAEIPPQP